MSSPRVTASAGRVDLGPPRSSPARGRGRFASLPRASVLGIRVPVASGFRARFLGLSHLDRADAGPGLLIPRCASVHTFGMRFALDLVFLDGYGRVLGVRRALAPRRLAGLRGAAAVLEIPAAPADSPRPRIFPASSAERRGERTGPPGP